MHPKQIFIAVSLIVLVGSIATFISTKRSKVTPKQVETVVVTPTPTVPVNLIVWNDEAGFSFKYPEGTEIDKHPEDSKNYANLTLTLPSKDTVQVIMADNKYKNLDEWVGENSALDTTLNDRPAKKILKGSEETIACIDNDVLVTITGKDTSTIVKSWTFIYPTPSAAPKATKTTAPADEDVLEEE